jgi:hypothetical protein
MVWPQSINSQTRLFSQAHRMQSFARLLVQAVHLVCGSARVEEEAHMLLYKERVTALFSIRVGAAFVCTHHVVALRGSEAKHVCILLATLDWYLLVV